MNNYIKVQKRDSELTTGFKEQFISVIEKSTKIKGTATCTNNGTIKIFLNDNFNNNKTVSIDDFNNKYEVRE